MKYSYLLFIWHRIDCIIGLRLCSVTVCCHGSHGASSLCLRDSIGCGTGWWLTLRRTRHQRPLSLFNGCGCRISTEIMKNEKYSTNACNYYSILIILLFNSCPTKFLFKARETKRNFGQKTSEILWLRQIIQTLVLLTGLFRILQNKKFWLRGQVCNFLCTHKEKCKFVLSTSTLFFCSYTTRKWPILATMRKPNSIIIAIVA